MFESNGRLIYFDGMSVDVNLDLQSDLLASKTKHYLITTMGRVFDEANIEEVYRAFSYALREEIMINWLACTRTHLKQDPRILYYLSMEYLPGRILSNTITNISATEIVQSTMQKLGRNFSEIMSRENDPGLGNGGLGRLASCFLDSLATLHYPAQGYGLRYQYGIFEQQIWDGVQIEAPDCWLLNEYPWEFRRDLKRATVKYGGQAHALSNINGDEIYQLTGSEEVAALPFDIPIVGYAPDARFSVVTLRLWSTKESPRNFKLQRYNAGRLDQAAENTTLTDVLYPSDNTEIGKRIRLKQEFLLVSASMQDIIRKYLTNHENFRQFGDKVRLQINDTHPSLIIAELIRILMQEHDIPWYRAVEITRECTGYTNHTILSEALEQWDQTLMFNLLPRQYKIIERLNYDFLTRIRGKYPDNEDKVRRMSIIEEGRVRMANLAIVGSHKVNGVARIHSEILKNQVFHDFYEEDPEKFVNVTNGVTQRRWLLHCNPDLARFITQRIGNGWITNFNQIKRLADFAREPLSRHEMMQIKRKNKQRLIEFLYKENKMRNSQGVINDPCPLIDVDSIFDVQVKRIHEYKRQLLNALHLIMVYQELLENPHSKRVARTALIGGKAAASYETAKDIIRLICCMGRKINHDPRINGRLKIIFIENYNVSHAEKLMPAADLSEQISTAGTEASGTGNMKLSINGALTIGTNDGANIEMRESITDAWWPFVFGASAEEIDRLRASGTYNPKGIYENDPKIKRALDTLIDRTWAHDDDDHLAFSDLFHKLLEGHYGGPPDRYFTLLDLPSYYEAQKKVEELYRDQEQWETYVFHNMAGMGPFSTDNSIQEYNRLIWGLAPCPIDEEIFARVKQEYSEQDRCRIY